MKLQYLSLIFMILLFCLGCASQKKTAKVNQPVAQQNIKSNDKSLDLQLENLTGQIITSLSQKQKSKIAVIEFANLQGQITEFGRYMAEELITRLYRTQKFEVIERQLLNKVLREHQLNMSGLIDATSAKELGRLLGVDAIASGSVTDLGNSVKVNARMISTETGKIFSVASATIDKDATIRKLMGETISDYPVASPGSIVMDAPAPGNLDMNVKVGEYTLSLNSCTMANRTVTFSMILKNDTEDDHDLTVWFRPTKIFDQSGNEYPLHSIKIANSDLIQAPDYGWGGSSRTSKMLVPDVPTPMTLTFEKVSEKATEISLLTISLGNVGDAKFRNIPIDI